MTLSVSADKRAHSRSPCNCVVNLTDDSDHIHVMMANNVSCGGLGVVSSNALTEGEFVQVKFKVKSTLMKGENDQHEVTAEVVQVRKQGGLYLAGLRFLEELTLH